jgi:hypothetical protein
MEYMGYGMDSVRDAVKRIHFDVAAGFKALGAVFDWRMQTVIAILEEQSRAQNEIRDLLKYPRATASDELKERARKSYYKALGTVDANLTWREGYWLTHCAISASPPTTISRITRCAST